MDESPSVGQKATKKWRVLNWMLILLTILITAALVTIVVSVMNLMSKSVVHELCFNWVECGADLPVLQFRMYTWTLCLENLCNQGLLNSKLIVYCSNGNSGEE